MVRVQVESGWLVENTGRVTGQPVFASGQKNRVQVKYFLSRVRKFDPFCHVYQKVPTNWSTKLI